MLLLQINLYLRDLSVELERTPFKVVAGNRGAKVDAHVEGLAGGEGARHGNLRDRARDFVAINAEHDVGGRAGPRGLKRGIHNDGVFAGRELFLRLRDVALDDHHVVFVDEVPLVHVAGETAARTAEGVEYAAGVLTGFEVDGDLVTLAAQAGRGKLRHAIGGVVKGPALVGAFDTRRGIDAGEQAAANREGLVLLGF